MDVKDIIAALLTKAIKDPKVQMEEKIVLNFFKDIIEATSLTDIENAWIKLLEEDSNIGPLFIKTLLEATTRANVDKLNTETLITRAAYTVLRIIEASGGNDYTLPALAKLICAACETINIDPVELLIFLVPARNNFNKQSAPEVDLITQELLVTVFNIYKDLKKGNVNYKPNLGNDFFSSN